MAKITSEASKAGKALNDIRNKKLTAAQRQAIGKAAVRERWRRAEVRREVAAAGGRARAEIAASIRLGETE